MTVWGTGSRLGPRVNQPLYRHSRYLIIFIGRFVQQFVHQSFQLLKGEPAEALTEETGVWTEKSTVVELLLENEEKCFVKMTRDPPYSRSGSSFLSSRSHFAGWFLLLTCLRCRTVLWTELGRLAVLGRHPGWNLRLPKLPRDFQRL